jgi:hypothetical protein
MITWITSITLGWRRDLSGDGEGGEREEKQVMVGAESRKNEISPASNLCEGLRGIGESSGSPLGFAASLENPAVVYRRTR